MPNKKIPETPDFVKGLLKSAETIDKLLKNSEIPQRDLLKKLGDQDKKLEDFSPLERQELGIYQARVVLMVLAVELALKRLWEQEKGRAAKKDHKINDLFNELSKLRQGEINTEYSNLAKEPPAGWEKPKKILELCQGASVQWRYLVEEKNFPDYTMQARYLKLLTSSVLQVSKMLEAEN